MKPFCLLMILVGLNIASENAAKAQSLNDTIKLETIQVIGNRFSRNFNETRTEVDSMALVKSSTLRLSELLSQNTPIFVKEYGRGAMATASFRGTAPSHTKVIWNGLELNSPMLGMVDFSLIPVYFTDEVKLMHGSSSLSESAGALGGTILLENIPDWNNTISGKLLSGIGSYQTFDEYIQLNGGSRKIQSKNAVFYNSSANDFPFVNKLNASIDPVTGEYIYQKERNRNAGYLNYGFLDEIYLRLASNQTFSVKTWLQHNQRSIPTLLTNENDAAFNMNRQSENSLRSVAEWRAMSSKSRTSILSAINLQNSEYKLENSISGASNQMVEDANAKIFTNFNKISYRYQVTRAISSLTGIEADLFSVISENRTLNQNSGYNKKRVESSVSEEIEANLNQRWDAVLLFREVLIDLKHQAFLPLARMSYQPDPERAIKLTASVAGNCHTPTLNDLYFTPGGNPNLQSEKSIQGEFGILSDLMIEKKHLNTGISLFYSNVKDWIIWLPTFQGYWEPSNIDRVNSNGIEANMGWNGYWGPIRFDLKGNYAFTRTVNLSTNSPAYGKQLPYIPKNSANLNLHLKWFRLSFDWMWNYYSKRFTTTSNSEETYSDYLYPYFMNNLQIGIDFPAGSKKITIECKIQNIFNENYRTVLQRPMPGRNY